ncbi:hypothetical protein GCM10023094_00390 [Rhodococcus olei]|uniref:DUF1778 domain-containing protein n=1 Tax=Rhodococcus olei TaxID=2161675 RepID=A0ABP8NSS3_9NOCA
MSRPPDKATIKVEFYRDELQKVEEAAKLCGTTVEEFILVSAVRRAGDPMEEAKK